MIPMMLTWIFIAISGAVQGAPIEGFIGGFFIGLLAWDS